MKSCPICNRTYADETLTFCLIDGSILTAPHEPPETQRIPAPRRTDPAPTMPSPQPPFYSGERPLQTPAGPGKKKGRLLIGGALLGGALVLAIILGLMWLGVGNAVDESKIPNTNEISTKTPPVTGGGSNMSIEYDTDRPGADYKDYDLPQPSYELCRDACAVDAKCRAYTYVKPGVQGLKARCWLKSSVPAPGSSDCCISGVKR